MLLDIISAAKKSQEFASTEFMAKILLVLVPAFILLGSCDTTSRTNNNTPEWTSEPSPTEFSETTASPEPVPAESSEAPKSSPTATSEATSIQITETSILGCWSRTTESAFTQYDFYADKKYSTSTVYPELAQVTTSSGRWSLEDNLISLAEENYVKSLRLVSPNEMEISPGSGDIYRRCEA